MADPTRPDFFSRWIEALEARHLEQLTFPELRRALQALSSLYVERRGRLGGGGALEGAGKRAAFAAFYAPLHFLLVRGIVRELGAEALAVRRIHDLGCGTGAASAAWASEVNAAATGYDLSGWALDEARWNWRQLRVAARAQRLDLARAPMPKAGEGLIAAWTVNELDEASRDRLLPRLLEAGRGGAFILVVEPISRRAVPWFEDWAEAFSKAGGRADAWRLPAELPEFLRRLDTASGLDHSELTGRSLLISGRSRPGRPVRTQEP